MHLNKLFNGKYLLQNIKKSKMTIALFFLLIPLFTSLMIIAVDDYTFEFASLASINIMGMYMIPFIFSMCLFGYVFKKNSVDFIGSMPISRKCIFITNTVGGIALILLMQVVTFFLTLLISSLTNGIVFTSMAWDILVFQTIAYIFVFVVANLAMSLSGTLVTQIAVTMLIVFLVPFSTWFVNIMSSNYNGMEYTLMNNDIEIMSVDKTENYTAPFLIANNGEYTYNISSMWKMIILTIIYFVIGCIVFDKKKMEIAGESFENKYIHFLVKGLTLIPFVAVLKAISDESLTLSAIIIAIIVVYYIVFDLITSKKMKFFENLIAVVVSIATLYGAFSIAIVINENIDRQVDIDKIKTVNININNQFYTRIQDKNEIKTSMATLSKAVNNYSYYNEAHYNMEVTLVKNNGTKFSRTIYVGEKTLKEMFDDSYKANTIGNKAVITNTQLKLTRKENEEILKKMNESLKEMTVEKLLNSKKDIDYLFVILSEYKNHELINVYYPIVFDQDIQKIVMGAYNRYAVECLKSGYSRTYYTIDSFDKFNEETRQKIWFVTSNEYNDVFSQFILAHINDVPGNIQSSIKIGTSKFTFYTDKIEEFLAMVDKVCEENKEQFEEYKSGYGEEYYSSFPDKMSSSAKKETYEETTDVEALDEYDMTDAQVSGENLQANDSSDTI